MIRLKVFANDRVSEININIDDWINEETPNIINAKMQSGCYNFEILIIYDDLDTELLP